MIPRGRVLVIAGSDSGGGAGIQADIKTVMALGGFATTAITAITAQNTLGVFGVHPIPPEMVLAQGRVVLSDIGADAVKTGMLASRATIEAAALLIDEAGAPAVIDPVMVASSGARLIEDDAVWAITRLLIPRAALLTPNAPEAAALTGLTVETSDDLRRAGEILLEAGAKAVLMKGGHIAGETLTDILTPATPTAPAAPWLRPAPRAWPRACRCRTRSRAPGPTSPKPSATPPTWAPARGR